MTIALPFTNFLRSLFFKPSAAKAMVEGPAVKDGMVKLARMIVVVAHLPGNSKPVKLMATEVGNNRILFKTNLRIREGELVSIETLLQGHGNFKAMAKVEWVLHSSKNFTGQIVLYSPRPDQRQALAEFTERQRELAR
jgi:hypothetical protein